MWPGLRERRRGGGGEERWIETEAGAKRGGEPGEGGDKLCEWRRKSSADDETVDVWECARYAFSSPSPPTYVCMRQGREGAKGGDGQELLSFRTVRESTQTYK